MTRTAGSAETSVTTTRIVLVVIASARKRMRRSAMENALTCNRTIRTAGAVETSAHMANPVNMGNVSARSQARSFASLHMGILLAPISRMMRKIVAHVSNAVNMAKSASMERASVIRVLILSVAKTVWILVKIIRTVEHVAISATIKRHAKKENARRITRMSRTTTRAIKLLLLKSLVYS